MVELFLSPAVERVIVALSAADACSHKHADGVIEIVERHVGVAKHETDGGVLPDLAFRRKHFVDDLVPGIVVPQALFDPVAVRSEIGVTVNAVDESHDVCQPVIHLAAVAGLAQQSIDQRDPFGRRTRPQKHLCLIRRRDRARRVEINPSKELFVCRWFVRIDVVFSQVGFDQFVDSVSRPDG